MQVLAMKVAVVSVRFVPCLALLAWWAAATAQAAVRPNVLLILVDDLKPSFGCYGDDRVHAPNLDRLADAGMRFDRAYCNQAVCAPSRNNLLTGSRSTSIGVYSLGYNFRRAVPDARTMPQHFMLHGYHTAGIGKVFHVGHGNIDDEGSWSVPLKPEKVIDYVLPESTGGRLTREEALFANLPARGLPRGAAWERADVDDEAYSDGRIAAEAIKRLQSYKQSGQPFFLALGFTKPHLPFCAPGRYWDLYDPAQLSLAEFTTPPIGAPAYAGKTFGELDQYEPVPSEPPLTDDLARTLIHGYYAAVSYMDAQVGRVLDALHRLELHEQTIVVLWGDHGYHLGDHGMWTKHTNYEQANRIPLLFVAPGVTVAGSSSRALVESVDVFPTLCELAGLPAPDGPQPIDGRSLVGVLKDGAQQVRDHAYHCFPRGNRLGRAIRTDRYRLVEWRQFGQTAEGAEYELYDYQTDPLETTNLAERLPEVVAQLARILADHPKPLAPAQPQPTVRPRAAAGQAPTGAKVRLAAQRTEGQAAKVTMRTVWGQQIEDDAMGTAWPEYPRPTMRRGGWTNLNGWWDYAITGQDAAAAPQSWDGKIRVPFAIEAPLSGVERRLGAEEALWYRRTVNLVRREGGRVRLNFEGVDYEATVWVNSRRVGSHTGGNLPFSFDVTEALVDGENVLTVRVVDATDSAYQLHGKQRLEPKGIWYTPVSGIWQTVWIEEVPQRHVTALKITPRTDGRVTIAVAASGDAAKSVGATVIASLEGREVARASGPADAVELAIPDPRLWSPASPTLYDLRIELGDDVVESYVGLREVGRRRDADGHWRLTLNGQEIFHWGTLDQGWWPDGLLTPPGDEAMRWDVEFLKAAGFNTIRKHIKVEPRRYYYHCDKLGMLLWQDQVSAMVDNPPWTRLAPEPEDPTWPEAAHRQFMVELQGMIDLLYNHPSIVQWVPFNERWGQHQTVEVGRWTVDYDPTRLVNIASGGNWFPVGHIVDHHQYPHPAFPFELGAGNRFDEFVKVVGEFGGHGFPVEGHIWSSQARNWGYGGLPENKQEWLERYRESIRRLAQLRQQGIAGGIYTQTSDVEGEINGLLTYDRKVAKIPAAQLLEIHRAAGLVD